jgi:hypothetical protein
MATAFPIATYPLTIDTAWADAPGVTRDKADDGTPFVRQIGLGYRTFGLAFIPMIEDTADALMDYLQTNVATEFDISGDGLGGATVRGYFWSDPQIRLLSGGVYQVTVEFYGQKV